jgi:glycosyltransferase involved in cell wall biosynthesis
MTASSPGISVVIRTKDSAKTLGSVIERLGLDDRDQLIIVDSGSKDATLSIAAKHRAKVVVADVPFDYSKTLNLGFASAGNPWVLVLSSHCIPVSARYLDDLRDAILSFPGEVVVAYGSVHLVPQKASIARRKPVCYLTPTDWLQNRTLVGGNGNALYRRTAWERHNFKLLVHQTAEDLEWFLWAMSNGCTVALVPAAAVLSRNQGSLRHMFQKGVKESKVSREVLGARSLPLSGLCIGIASFLKQLLLMRISVGTFLRESARQYGSFRSLSHADK